MHGSRRFTPVRLPQGQLISVILYKPLNCFHPKLGTRRQLSNTMVRHSGKQEVDF